MEDDPRVVGPTSGTVPESIHGRARQGLGTGMLLYSKRINAVI